MSWTGLPIKNGSFSSPHKVSMVIANGSYQSEDVVQSNSQSCCSIKHLHETDTDTTIFGDPHFVNDIHISLVNNALAAAAAKIEPSSKSRSAHSVFLSSWLGLRQWQEQRQRTLLVGSDPELNNLSSRNCSNCMPCFDIGGKTLEPSMPKITMLTPSTWWMCMEVSCSWGSWKRSLSVLSALVRMALQSY